MVEIYRAWRLMMSRLVPKLRFKEFSGEWEEKKLGKIGDIITGNTPKTNEADNYGSEILFVSPADISENRYIYTTDKKLTPKGFLKTRVVKAKSILVVCIGSTIGKVAQNTIECATNQQINSIIPFKENCNDFIYSTLEKDAKKIKGMAGNHAVPIINKTAFSNILILLPKEQEEQQKIANTLSSLDNLIEAQQRKVEALQKHKKGLMQQLFPSEGANEPKLRFKEFSGEWEEKKLGDCLDYLQPTKYLVSNTDYNDKYKTPVLTAGKTFILGYTNETNGIFKDNLPVIIFDDFTTATKYVDFPFKAKSSAMKILIAKDNINIKFMYELLQMIKYEVGNHERHWISKFAILDILIPTQKEQQKIANTLSSLDNLIEAHQRKVEALKKHKKGLMQQMFVSKES